MGGAGCQLGSGQLLRSPAASARLRTWGWGWGSGSHPPQLPPHVLLVPFQGMLEAVAEGRPLEQPAILPGACSQTSAHSRAGDQVGSRPWRVGSGLAAPGLACVPSVPFHGLECGVQN